MLEKQPYKFSRLLPLLRPHLKSLIWGGVCMVIYVSCWPLLAWLSGQLIPAIGRGDLSEVSRVILKALGIFLVQKTAQLGQDTLLASPALYISQDLRKRVFNSLQKIKLEYIEKLSSGDITYRLTEDAERVGEIVYKTIQDTTPSILQLVTVFGYMVYIDFKLSLATLLLAPLVTLLVSSFGEKVMFAAEKSQKKISDLAGLVTESIVGLPLVRAFAAENWLKQRFEKEVILHRKARYKTLKLLALQHPVVGFIEAVGILAILIVGTFRIQNGGLDSAGFSSFVAALLMLIDPISHLTTNFNELKQGQASLRRLMSIEDEPIEEQDKDDSISLTKTNGKIELKRISFSYSNKKTILENINIKFENSQMTALVGPSGAGKSTIFSLLLRFNIPNEGKITLDGVNIQDIKANDLRSLIALVPQKNKVFSGSIRDTILFGREASNEQLINSCKIANAHEFILDLPDGYNTKVEEGGSNLSGGQIQRLSIARAVLGNPSILLLDEATSALDAEAEVAVQLGLKQAMKGRTVIVIAHRLVTVQEADKIYFIDKGKVMDHGNHKELIQNGGRYRELCEKQFIKEININ
tara:strand:- start:302 stop:2047 length:1746 start_codon:yes stop_codon:yes gene_type:complete